MKIARKMAAITLIFSVALPIASGSDASTATYSEPGTLGSSGTWADQLIFTDPNVTATFDVTNASYKAGLGDNTCMQTDSCGWWYVDDIDGFNCYSTFVFIDSSCDDETSLTNSALAFTPSSVSDTEGVTWTWRSTRCGDITSVYPTPAEPSIDCPDVSTVTINFSDEVSNAIVHIANLGGIYNRPSDRSVNFDEGFDNTLVSAWTLTSGQDIVQLSGSDTTNIKLSGNVIHPAFVPQGLGARPGVGDCEYNDPTCRYRNGTGSGSFLVIGTYSQITFEIDLLWSLVNYGINNPSDWTSMLNDWASGGSSNVPEGVSVQISFYESGPALPTTTTVDPGTTSTTTEPESSTTTDAQGPTTTGAPELPPTGGSTSGLSLALLVAAIGSLVMVLRRRAA